MALLPRVRAEILDYRPDVPINDIATLKAITARSFGDVSFAMALVMIAAVVALFLGVVGIYGTVSYVVGRRTREFGLRIALGASAPEVTRSVLRDSGRIGLIGIALGAGAAALCSRVLESMLFEVSGVTPSIYGGVAALLFAVVLVAALVPARRAASVDPVEALKAD
jgi:ABC-type antimicrobial peptide transport system permease subunit